MNAALPPVLLCAALGLALAFAPRRALAPAFAALVAAALASAALASAPPAAPGVWLSLALTAAAVHWPRGLPALAAIALAANAGAWTGASAAAPAIVAALLAFPAAWLARTPAAIAIKVVASWLIAAALLALALPFVQIAASAPEHRD